MKAIRLFEFGKPPVLTEMPTPTIAHDEVLVKVRSTAVNHLDLVEASGMAKEFFPIQLPWVPGHEFSGVVERVGTRVESFAPGVADRLKIGYEDVAKLKPGEVSEPVQSQFGYHLIQRYA